MAYTGILLRGDTYDAIVADPPIAREAVMAGEKLGLGTLSGVVHYLNIAMLAAVGDTETKTSEFPILFDGGELQVNNQGLVVRGTQWYFINITESTATNLTVDGITINPTALQNISYGDATQFTIDSITMNPTELSKITKATSAELIVDGQTLIPTELAKIITINNNMINGYEMSAKPTITAISVNDITVDFILGDKVEVYNDTTSTLLGEITTSGGTLTFSAAQTTGDVIYVWGVDADDNKTLQRKGLIP